MLAHQRVAVAHTFQNKWHHDWHRHGTGFVLRLFTTIISFTVVRDVIAQMGHRVVGTVATYGAGIVKVVVQSVLFDELMYGQCHAAALRVAEADALPVTL